jgi:hypothetical protein
MSGSASTGQAAFRYETRLEPAIPDLSGKFGGGGVMVGKTGIHRYMTEAGGRKYFGYDLVLEPLPEANTYRATVRPLSVDAARLQLENPAAWSKLPLPGYPAAQTLHGGDTIALDLLVNRETGQKIVDYIHIQDHKRLVYTASGQARDFSLNDVELRLMDARVSVNGKLLDSTAADSGGVTGAVVWFYLPERGRYFLSLVPHARYGLEKAGEVRGSTLSFTAGGETIAVDCNGSIAPGSAAYNLYVLHQPAWRPKEPESRGAFLLTGADRLDLLLRN